VPARLKFLKRDLTEAMAVSGVVEKIALSHPEIAFKLISDGAVKLETAGDGKLYGAIRSVYGKDFASKMIEVDSSRDGIRINGYITSPDAPRANRNYQNFFINGRYIKTKTATAAIEQAYTSYIPPDKFPGCVMNITLSPAVVDVNVHPSKLEVKFSNERPVFDIVYHGVRSALQENRERPSLDIGFNEHRSFSSPILPKVSTAFVPVADKKIDGGEKPQTQLNIISDYPTSPKADPAFFDNKAPEIVFHSKPVVAIQESPKQIQEVEKTPVSQVLHKSPEELSYRILGELFNSYIVVEKEASVLIIDKHAAHERLNFEKMKKALYSSERATQCLAIPIELMLMSDEIAAVEEYREQIEDAGFSFKTTRNTVYISEIPIGIEQKSVSLLFESFGDVIKNGTGSVDISAETVFEKALYQASCKASIKAGRVYPEGYAQWLVKELLANPEVTYCPHGRPVAFEITRNELNHKFKRS
jgi:DNA mismatch repair protein MutL